MVSDTFLVLNNARLLKLNYPETREIKLSQEQIYAMHDENKFMSVLEPKEIEGMKVIVNE